MAFLVKDWNHLLGCSICEACGVDPNTVRRVVLDLQIDHPGLIYLETYADEAVLEIQLGAGIEVTPGEPPATS